jgi:membrane-bound metal-dependent hydrolase YbcI (DUF457 family)
MPTPVGHALAGLATAWFSRSVAGTKVRPPPAFGTKLAVACILAAVAPDVDILVHSHRTYTHSLGAVIVVGVVVWSIQLLTARLKPRATGYGGPLSVALTVAAAYGTHILLDLLGKDTAPPFGLTALWPFSSRFYVSGADLFMEISRRYWKPDEFILGNLKAGAWELLVIGPVAAVAWFLAKRNSEKRRG